jgi:type IV pilus assembly protein PilO
MDELFERYSDLPSNQRYILGAMVLAALVVGHFTFIYDSQKVILGVLQSKMQLKNSERMRQTTIAQDRARFESRVGELEQSLRDARLQLPDTADVPQLLTQAGNRASEIGLTLDSFSPGAETKREFYAEIVIAMDVTGTYHEVAMFIDSLARLERIINVTDLSIRNPKASNSRTLIKSKFSIKTYRFLAGGG